MEGGEQRVKMGCGRVSNKQQQMGEDSAVTILVGKSEEPNNKTRKHNGEQGEGE
jgi:hypothetical protein